MGDDSSIGGIPPRIIGGQQKLPSTTRTQKMELPPLKEVKSGVRDRNVTQPLPPTPVKAKAFLTAAKAQATPREEIMSWGERDVREALGNLRSPTELKVLYEMKETVVAFSNQGAFQELVSSPLREKLQEVGRALEDAAGQSNNAFLNTIQGAGPLIEAIVVAGGLKGETGKRLQDAAAKLPEKQGAAAELSLAHKRQASYLPSRAATRPNVRPRPLVQVDIKNKMVSESAIRDELRELLAKNNLSPSHGLTHKLITMSLLQAELEQLTSLAENLSPGDKKGSSDIDTAVTQLNEEITKLRISVSSQERREAAAIILPNDARSTLFKRSLDLLKKPPKHVDFKPNVEVHVGKTILRPKLVEGNPTEDIADLSFSYKHKRDTLRQRLPSQMSVNRMVAEQKIKASAPKGPYAKEIAALQLAYGHCLTEAEGSEGSRWTITISKEINAELAFVLSQGPFRSIDSLKTALISHLNTVNHHVEQLDKESYEFLRQQQPKDTKKAPEYSSLEKKFATGHWAAEGEQITLNKYSPKEDAVILEGMERLFSNYSGLLKPFLKPPSK